MCYTSNAHETKETNRADRGEKGSDLINGRVNEMEEERKIGNYNAFCLLLLPLRHCNSMRISIANLDPKEKERTAMYYLYALNLRILSQLLTSAHT